jgi:hypothetical protein
VLGWTETEVKVSNFQWGIYNTIKREELQLVLRFYFNCTLLNDRYFNLERVTVITYKKYLTTIITLLYHLLKHGTEQNKNYNF